jgi:hypothetical protein
MSSLISPMFSIMFVVVNSVQFNRVRLVPHLNFSVIKGPYAHNIIIKIINMNEKYEC